MASRLTEYVREAQRFTTKAITFHDALARSLGLHLTDLKALRLLADNPLTPSDLVSQTGLTGAAVTALLDRLEASKFIARVRDLNDRRKIAIHVLPKKAKLLAELYKNLGDEMEGVLKNYSEKDFALIMDYLVKATEALSHQIESLKLPQ